MIDTLFMLVNDRISAIALGVLALCTLATGLGLLVSRLRPRSAAYRATILRVGMFCALICPVVAVGLDSVGVTWLTLPLLSPTYILSPTSAAERHYDFIGNDVNKYESYAAVPPPRLRDTVDTTAALVEPDFESSPAINVETGEQHEHRVTIAGQSSQQLDDEQLATVHKINPSHPPAESIVSWPSTRNLFQGCLALWAVGFLAGCFGIVRSWRKLHLILRDARPIDDPGLQSIVRQVQTALATTRPFRVITSDTLQSPVAARMYRPVIMLPEELSRQLSPSEMRLVLLHEGAHIIRHDHVTLLAERVFVAAFWFHPLVHLLVRQLARAREEVCDNYVLQNIDAPSFGETLLRLTNLTSSRSQVAYGVVSSSRS